jgi:hypothetical protein
MARSNGRTEYEVYWPRGRRQMSVRPLAPRLDTLEGKTIAELWDYVFRGDEVYAVMEEALNARYPGVRFISWSEFGSTHGGDEREVVASLARRLKELNVDAVVSGMGC